MEHYNLQFFADGDETKVEEKITLTQKELDDKVKNAFAEGARKGSKSLLEELGFENKEAIKKIKEETELTKAEIAKRDEALKLKDDEINKRDVELSNYKAKEVALKFTDVANLENVLAIVRGKGQELNEANIEAAAKLFPKSKGQVGTITPSNPTEKTELEKYLEKRPYK